MWRWLKNPFRSPRASTAQARPDHEIFLRRRLLVLPILEAEELRDLQFTAGSIEGSSWALIDHVGDVIRNIVSAEHTDSKSGRAIRKTATEKLEYELLMTPANRRLLTLSGTCSTTIGPKAKRLVTKQMISIARTAEDRFRVRRYAQEMSFEWN